jgi:hypothetical protein
MSRAADGGRLTMFAARSRRAVTTEATGLPDGAV